MYFKIYLHPSAILNSEGLAQLASASRQKSGRSLSLV